MCIRDRDPDDTFFKELVKYHVSGQLKVAPDHCSAAGLDKMGRPHIEAYIEFSKRYFRSVSYTHLDVYKRQEVSAYRRSTEVPHKADKASKKYLRSSI